MEPSLYVDKWYVANIEFEDIVFGKHLRDGMVVLHESEMMRVDMEEIHSSSDQARADEFNRWCTVSQLEIIPGVYGPMVRFIALYPDGTMRVRSHSADQAWIVKRDTRTDAPRS